MFDKEGDAGILIVDDQPSNIELPQQQAELLEQGVLERTRDLEGARLEVLDRLGRVAEFRDDETGEHTLRVGRTAAVVAAMLGLDRREVELIRRSAPLHDIGKIAVPDAILLKPGALSEAEMELMREHTTIGLRILAGGRSQLMKLAEEIALYHHEWWDGSGYPHRLQGPAIPRAARIVTVVDVFDALVHERPYKRAWPRTDALAHIEARAGTQFDPEVVRAFLDAVRGGKVIGYRG
jgi:putative two-component system response regulator